MPLSASIDKRKRQLNAIIVAAFKLRRDDVLSLDDPLGEEDDLAVLALIEENLSGIQKSRRGETLQRMYVWLDHRITDSHVIGLNPVLSYRDFKGLKNEVEYAAVKCSLMNYAKALHTSSNERMDAELGQNQVYVQQMAEIGLSEDEQTHGARCFLVAAINRDGWLSDESIMDEDVEDFENRLLAGYKQRRANVNLQFPNATPVEKGVALHNACMDPAFCRNISICNRDPLDMTVEGSFHLLANACEIGWHPDWKQKFKANGGSDGTVA